MRNKIFLGVKQSRGFTLVELLAVIAILGILIAVAVPNLFGTIDRVEAESLRADARSVKNAVITYITLDGVDRGKGDGLDSNDIETLVGDGEGGTLNEYIDMSADRAKLLDEELGNGDFTNWDKLLEALDDLIENGPEDSEE